jgi:hypothetical protein
MEPNMGFTDRFIRAAIALGLLYAAYTHYIVGTWAVVAVIVGVVFLLTSIVRFCPLYTILGFKTCKR